MTYGEELALLDGTTPEDVVRAFADVDVDALGVNCGAGPQACLDALERTGGGPDRLARSILPNAGLSQRVSGQFVYAAGPDYFGKVVPRMLAAGATIVGGCCGTTPAHVAAMRVAIDAIETSDTRRASRSPARPWGRHRRRQGSFASSPMAAG